MKRQKFLDLSVKVTPETELVNNLENIEVRLDGAPSWHEILSYVPRYLMSTWAQDPTKMDFDDLRRRMAAFYEDESHLPNGYGGGINRYTDIQIAEMLFYRALRGKFLPTLLETVRLNTTFNGISGHDVTHLLRYRQMSFFADCTGDKTMAHRKVVVPYAVQNNADFYERYKIIARMSKELYADMINSGNYTIQDARSILPRMTETFYHVSMSLRDALHFINHRIDQQIQPESDNIMAYQLATELIERYPMLADFIDLNAPNKFFIMESQGNFKSGFTAPLPQNDTFEYTPDDFNSMKTRSELCGQSEGVNETFLKLKGYYDDVIARRKEQNKSAFAHIYDTLEFYE